MPERCLSFEEKTKWRQRKTCLIYSCLPVVEFTSTLALVLPRLAFGSTTNPYVYVSSTHCLDLWTATGLSLLNVSMTSSKEGSSSEQTSSPILICRARNIVEEAMLCSSLGGRHFCCSGLSSVLFSVPVSRYLRFSRFVSHFYSKIRYVASIETRTDLVFGWRWRCWRDSCTLK